LSLGVHVERRAHAALAPRWFGLAPESREAQWLACVESFESIVNAIELDDREPDLWEEAHLARALNALIDGHYFRALRLSEATLVEPGARGSRRPALGHPEPMSLRHLRVGLEAVKARGAVRFAPVGISS
jgi:hypothetical protein